MIKTVNYDQSLLSPSQIHFYVRPYALRASQGFWYLGNVTDWDEDLSRDSDTVSQTAPYTGGVSMPLTVYKDPTGTLDVTYNAALSVESHDLMEAAFKNNELLEIRKVYADVTADGSTVKDSDGNVVPAGWMKDRAMLARINEIDDSASHDDTVQAVDVTMDLMSMPVNSWIEPLPISSSVEYDASNTSLRPYAASDNPTYSRDDVNDDGFAPQNGANQQSLFNAPVAVTGVTVTPTTLSVNVGLASQIMANVAPTNASNKAVVYTISDGTVATVSSTGVVTGLKAGTATVTIRSQADATKTATVAVTITAS